MATFVGSTAWLSVAFAVEPARELREVSFAKFSEVDSKISRIVGQPGTSFHGI